LPVDARVQVNRAFRFRLYPTEAQVAELSEWERQLRWLYNLAHEQRLAGLARHRPPRDSGQCPSCLAPAIDVTEHVLECPRSGYKDGKCVECGASKKSRTDHTAACAWVDYYSQGHEMTEMMRSDTILGSQLARVVCSARQEVLRDLEKAWQRWRKGLGGKPHFKRRVDPCRIYFSTPNSWKVEAGHLSFSGIAGTVGKIRIRQDRPWPGDAKWSSCHVTRDVDQWYAVFPLEYSVEVENPKGGAVGINRGAVHAIADSNGRVVDSPRFYGRALGIIQYRSRDVARKLPRGRLPVKPETRYHGLDPARVEPLARELGHGAGRIIYEAKKRGGLDAAAAYLRTQPVPVPSTREILPSLGRNQNRAKVKVAIAHRVVRWQRQHFLHNESAYYTRAYSLIGIEDWSTKEMTSSKPEKDQTRRVKRALNRSILDVGWYELGRQLKYKSEPAGAEVRFVEPGNKETACVLPTRALADLEEGEAPPTLAGAAGISRTCSRCGAVLDEPATGRKEMYCRACRALELGDLNAATNVLRRAMVAKPPAPKKAKVSIKIKGRAKAATAEARTASAGKPPVHASGGDPPGGPDEGGMANRETGHRERMVRP
jgi:transposase